MTTIKVTSGLCRAGVEKLRLLFSSKYLLYTNTAICIGMSCSADSLQQHLQIHKREMPHMNFRRSRDVAVTGLLIGPFCHYWYIFLDRWLPGKTMKIVTKKIIVDQFICSPVVIGMFLGTTLYLEGKNGSNIKRELYEKGKTLYAADWLIWPPAQAVNFFFLPTKYRVLYDNTISFMFDWYFSYVKYGKNHNNCDADILSVEGVEQERTYDSRVDIAVTAGHAPLINVPLGHVMQERTRKTKAKLLTLLHLDNIAADIEDMEGTHRPEEQTEENHEQTDLELIDSLKER